MSKGLLVFVILLILGASVAGVAISAKNDIASMQKQNFLFIVVNDKTEVAFGNYKGEFYIVKPSEVGINTVGKEVKAIFGDPSKGITKNIKIDRVVAIKSEVIGELIDLCGGADFEYSAGGVTLKKHISGSEMVSILKSDSIWESGEWEVSLTNPLTGKTETMKMSGEELPSLNISLPEWWIVRTMIFVVTVNKISESGAIKNDRTLKFLFESFKKGDIQVYPNTMAIKIARMLSYERIKNVLHQA